MRTLFNALNWLTEMGRRSFGMKKGRPSEQGGVVRDPTYEKVFTDALVRRFTAGDKSIDLILVSEPGVVIAGRPDTMESMNGTPAHVDS